MDIVEELRRDRESGARRLEAEYKIGLMTLARRFCVNDSDAEELVNATFATVVDNIDDYVEQSAFFAWMCQILRSKLARSARRKSSQLETFPGDMPDIPDESAEGEAYRALDASLLRDAIETLPPDIKKTLLLHYFMDMPVKEVARVLSTPTSTITWRLHYARKILAAKLGAAAKKPGGKALLLALALCGLTALGAAVWNLAEGALSERAASVSAAETAAETRTGATGGTGATGATSEGTGATGGTGATDASPASPARFASPAGPFVPFVPSVPDLSTPSAQEKQNMNATTLRTFAASAAFAAASTAIPAQAASEWFVSPWGSDNAAGTESAPLSSINRAIGMASAGDTITLLPGDYDEGGATVTLSNSLNRVHVTKKLTIRSLGREYRDTTRIVGAWDATATSPVGMGANSVRCAWIDMAASGTVFEDITFYRGATEYNNNSASLAGKMTSGGGAYQEGGSSNSTTGMEKTYFIDCAFVECSAPRGGGIYSEPFNNAWSVAAVRCLFKRCRGTRFGAGMRGGCAYFCVFDDCAQARNSSGTAIGQTDAAHAFSYGQRAVNCTFVNNEGYGIQVADSGNFKGGILNCLFQNNGSGAILNSDTTDGTKDGNTGNIAYNTERMEVFSPFDGDYRLTDIAMAATAGDPQYLGQIPDAYRSTDYNGATIDASGATIAAGAVQEVLEEPSCGVGFPRNYSGTWTLDGEKVAVNYCTWRGVAGWPSPQHVGFAPNAGVALVRLAIGGVAFWPLPDNTAWTHPAQAGMASTLNATTTGNIYWADPVNGSDGNAGTEAEPFKTLNAAVQATTATHVVYAKAGDYASAEEVSFGVRNRVVVPDTLAGELRVIAVDGPENTFITGAADPANASQGIGSGAIRCIAVNSTSGNRAAFQGFTLRNGHADAAANTENSYGGALRNLDSATHSPNTAFLLDCVVRDCAAHRGGAVAGGTVLRCRFENCAVWFCGLFRYCTVVSSFVTGSVGQPIIDSGATAYNCTFYANNSVAISTAGDANIRNCVVGGCTGGESDLNASALGASRVLYTLYSKNAAAGVANLNPAYVKMENPIRFIRPSRGNFRLAGYSAGLNLADTGYMQSCMDIDGFPFAFDAATGDFQSGCYAPRPDDDDVMPTTFIIR